MQKVRLETPWSFPHDDLFKKLETSAVGLSKESAEARLFLYGKNVFQKERHANVLKLFLRQAVSPFAFVLYFAMFFSFFLNHPVEGYFVAAAVVVNIALGFFQEYKANNALSHLETYVSHHARVRRKEGVLFVPADSLVPGDIVLLSRGERVSADMRLIESHGLEVDESILTGESLPVKKSIDVLPANIPLAERTGMVWAGTVVSEGTGIGVITATGKDTEIGRLAELVHTARDERTPLEKAVGKLARVISLFLILLGATIFGVGASAGIPFADILLLSVAIIVSAVPESLPIAMSVVLAMGAETLARKRGVIRKMAATETLGATTLILTDKTGTLTEASLRLVGLEAVSGTPDEALLLASLNTDVALDPESNALTGRPVEVAIANALSERKDLADTKKQYRVEDTLAFTSTRKFSAARFSRDDEEIVTLLGAPEILLEKTALAPEEKHTLRAKIAAYADSGERVLGVLSQKVSGGAELADIAGSQTFSFVGLVRFRDPIRAGVPSAVASITEAGVKTIMVTGDHPGTAVAIAKEVGIWEDTSLVVTGPELDAMPDKQLIAKLPRIRVFARVTPAHKLMLVELYEKQGEVVAVTGDGVNDAPALKRAAIGIAMGTGTDVAHASSDLIVLDDNYETIVEAIFEGRNVLRKMRSVITYLLADSFDELMLVGGAIVLSLPLPITALQILFVKFFSDIFPAMAFTFEKTGGFGRSTKPPKTRLFDKKIRVLTLGRGIIASTLLFGTYFLLLHMGFPSDTVRTFTFVSFASYILFLAFSLRNLDASILSYRPFSNKLLTTGVVVGFLTIMAAVYVPFLQNLLGTVALPLPWFVGVIAIGIANLFLVEAIKYRLNRHA